MAMKKRWDVNTTEDLAEHIHERLSKDGQYTTSIENVTEILFGRLNGHHSKTTREGLDEFSLEHGFDFEVVGEDLTGKPWVMFRGDKKCR